MESGLKVIPLLKISFFKTNKQKHTVFRIPRHRPCGGQPHLAQGQVTSTKPSAEGVWCDPQGLPWDSGSLASRERGKKEMVRCSW